MTSKTQITSHLNNVASQTGGIIGAVSFWSLRGAHMRRDDLRASLGNIGLAFAMPKDPKPQALLRMAIDHAKKTQPGLVFDRVHQNSVEIVYAVSARQTDEAAEIAQYQHRTRVRLNKTTGALTLEDTTDDVLLAVEAKYTELKERITVTEVGSVLINALRGRRKDAGLCAVNLRGESGGVYFVPAGNVDRLTALANAMDVLGQQGAVTVWPVPKGDRTVAQAVAAASSDFGARLAEAKADIAELMADLDGDKGGEREQSRILARAAAFAQLRTRIEVYAELLGDAQTTLLEQVGALAAKLQGRLSAALDAVDEDEDEAAA